MTASKPNNRIECISVTANINWYRDDWTELSDAFNEKIRSGDQILHFERRNGDAPNQIKFLVIVRRST